VKGLAGGAVRIGTGAAAFGLVGGGFGNTLVGKAFGGGIGGALRGKTGGQGEMWTNILGAGLGLFAQNKWGPRMPAGLEGTVASYQAELERRKGEYRSALDAQKSMAVEDMERSLAERGVLRSTELGGGRGKVEAAYLTALGQGRADLDKAGMDALSSLYDSQLKAWQVEQDAKAKFSQSINTMLFGNSPFEGLLASFKRQPTTGSSSSSKSSGSSTGGGAVDSGYGSYISYIA
jgi:hypothetical protein